MLHALRSILTLTALAVCSGIWAEIPPGYYDKLNGKCGADLKAAVQEVIYPHTEVSSYTALPSYFQITDTYPQSNKWWDMYSNVPRYAPSFSGLNREHSFPKSWWGGSQDTPAYVDLFHLYPADGPANMAKSNYPLGTVATPTYSNGVSTVGYPTTGIGGGAAEVFEPADEYKGDFARTYFYVVTCYSGYLHWAKRYSWMLQDNDYPSLARWAQEMLMQWARDDTRSQKEVDRNEAVYRIQNNRNPFIDFPQLHEYIWGKLKDKPFYTNLPEIPVGEPSLVTPVQDMALDFGEVAVGQTITSRLFFKGENCRDAFSITITGANRSLFTPDTRTISASLVNSPEGYWLNISYSPASLGEHTARLVISDGGLEGSRGIQLIGHALPVPSLTAVKALQPTGITASSYTANWEASAETVDYYIVTRTRYVGGFGSSEEIEAEGTSLVIDDFADSDYETYSVQGVRLGFRSPMSDIITVDHAGIRAVGADCSIPLAANCYPGYIRIVCPADHHHAVITDLQGRTVSVIPVLSDGMSISLAPGVYLLSTHEQHRPLKLIAY